MPFLSPTIIHADEDLIVVDKPAGLLSVPGRGEDRQDCLVARVQTRFTDALIVHRLDMATSGLMILARSKKIHRLLSMAFERRIVDKRYVAVVHGHIENDSGDINLPLICDWENRPRQIVDFNRGRPAFTHYDVIERSGEGEHATSRVELHPFTGRSHQLRVHLLSLGHPILGDSLYAPTVRCSRMHLHATRIAFDHPQTGQPMIFESPAPF